MPVVAAAAVFAHSKSKGLSDKIERAMLAAAEDARSKGITNPVAIRARMLAARKKVKDDLDL